MGLSSAARVVTATPRGLFLFRMRKTNWNEYAAEKALKDARASRVVGLALLLPGLAILGVMGTFLWERLEHGRINLNGIACALVIGIPLTWAGLKRILWPGSVGLDE
jgi:hypothetical protein